MISLRHPQRRLLSAFLALWLALCAVAICVVVPDRMTGESVAVVLDSVDGLVAQDHCASDSYDHRCDDRSGGQHRSLADILPLLALIALPFFFSSRPILIRFKRLRRPVSRLPLRLHLLNCVQLN